MFNHIRIFKSVFQYVQSTVRTYSITNKLNSLTITPSPSLSVRMLLPTSKHLLQYVNGCAVKRLKVLQQELLHQMKFNSLNYPTTIRRSLTSFTWDRQQAVPRGICDSGLALAHFLLGLLHFPLSPSFH